MEPLRGLGVGTLLVNVAEQRIQKRGLRWATLGVEDNNPRARALYERLGYRHIGQEPASLEQEDEEGNPEPPDRPRRLEVFAAAYGLTSTEGLVDAVIARQRNTAHFSRYLHDRGLVAPWTTTPSLRENEDLATWTEKNRELFS